MRSRELKVGAALALLAFLACAPVEIDKESLGAWDSDAHEFRAYPGSYSAMVGASSRDIRLKGGFPSLTSRLKEA